MKAIKPSTKALAVLALLYEEPMHPYRMQQLIQERKKDEVINVKYRASIYQTIDRLEKGGLIAVRETIKDDAQPERTIYEITDEGRETALSWVRTMLSTPADEFPEFPAALAFLPMLTPEDAQHQLEQRLDALEKEHDRIDNELQKAPEFLPRLFVVEFEYLRAMLKAEITWIAALVEDLRSGRMTWDEEWLRSIAEQFAPDGDE